MKKFFFLLLFPLFAFSSEKPFSLHIIISTYNSQNFIKKTLSSIFSQEEKKIQITLIDDGSEDQTQKVIENFLLSNDKEKKCHLIHYSNHLGLLERAYFACQNLDDHQIVVFLEESAVLANTKVLSHIAKKFEKTNCWFLSGQYVLPDNTKGKCTSKRLNFFSNSIREKFWHFCPIKAFYASLFKKIATADFFYKGKFFSYFYDMSYVFALLEMSSTHTHFCSHPLCIYNPHFLRQKHRPSDWSFIKTNRFIRKIKPYAKLENPFSKPMYQKSADLIVFSYARPLQLYALLESIQKHVKNLGLMQVIYRADTEKYKKAYKQIEKEFNNVLFLEQGKNPHEDFKKLTLEALNKTSSYVLFAVDDLLFKDDVDLSSCIENLERTHAFFFSFRLGEHLKSHYILNCNQKLPHLVEGSFNILSWQLRQAEYDWCYPTSVDVTLYRKKDIIDFFQKLNYIHPNSLEQLWYKKDNLLNHQKRLGLCFKTSKALNLAINQVHHSKDRFQKDGYSTDQLLDIFLNGQKMDISYFEKMLNTSAHMESSLPLMKRKMD